MKNHRRRNIGLEIISIPTIAVHTTRSSNPPPPPLSSPLSSTLPPCLPSALPLLFILLPNCFRQSQLQSQPALRHDSVLYLQRPHLTCSSKSPNRSPYSISLQFSNPSNIFTLFTHHSNHPALPFQHTRYFQHITALSNILHQRARHSVIVVLRAPVSAFASVLQYL